MVGVIKEKNDLYTSFVYLFPLYFAFPGIPYCINMNCALANHVSFTMYNNFLRFQECQYYILRGGFNRIYSPALWQPKFYPLRQLWHPEYLYFGCRSINCQNKLR